MGYPRSDTHLHRTSRDLFTQGWSPSMVSTCLAGKKGSGIVTDGAYSFTAELPI